MNLSDLHRRLLSDVLAIGTPYPLVITGGYAVQAHGLVDRLSQDLDVATENPAPMAEITRALTVGLAERGWQVIEVGVDPLSGRLVVTDPATGEQCEVDILKEAFWRPPAATEYGPVLALDDVIGTKVRALADRGAVRDLIDVHAASCLHTTADLETLGRRHARDELTTGCWYPRPARSALLARGPHRSRRTRRSDPAFRRGCGEDRPSVRDHQGRRVEWLTDGDRRLCSTRLVWSMLAGSVRPPSTLANRLRTTVAPPYRVIFDYGLSQRAMLAVSSRSDDVAELPHPAPLRNRATGTRSAAARHHWARHSLRTNPIC